MTIATHHPPLPVRRDAIDLTEVLFLLDGGRHPASISEALGRAPSSIARALYRSGLTQQARMFTAEVEARKRHSRKAAA